MSAVEIGVFGGSFDPPHVAHLLLASYALSAHGLERVLIVPTYAHAFAKRMASFEDRVRMCELAFAGLRGVEICEIERELPAPSYTLHTLRALAQRHPYAQLRLLIGGDILQETHAWHDFASVERLAPPLVIERSGTPIHDPSQPALPDVSSSELRRRIYAGESTRGWLDQRVDQYIRTHRLYRTG
ncbi:MAG: nicotinate (nicotinamide) nucleotide adenylyltransferase [Polyangiales bacterium]